MHTDALSVPWTTFLQPTITLLVGVAAASITVAQWKLALHKQRFELYPVRYEIYQMVMRHIGNLLTSGDISWEGVIQFGRDTARARFFFGPEIQSAISEIRRLSLNIHNYNLHVSSDRGLGPAPHLAPVLQKRGECVQSIERYLEIIPALFEPYISFGNIKTSLGIRARAMAWLSENEQYLNRRDP